MYEKFHWIKPIKHKCFSKEYDSHPLREPSPQTGSLIMIDGTPHDWFQNGRKSSLHLAIEMLPVKHYVVGLCLLKVYMVCSYVRNISY